MATLLTLDKSRNVREMLTTLGVGSYTASGIIPHMFVGVATSDPGSPPIIALVKAIQKFCGLPLTGIVDDATIEAFNQYAGAKWNQMAWFDLVKRIIATRTRAAVYRPANAVWRHPPEMKFHEALVQGHASQALSGALDFLPDIPGGLVTYGVVGFLLYKHFMKKKAA